VQQEVSFLLADISWNRQSDDGQGVGDGILGSPLTLSQSAVKKLTVAWCWWLMSIILATWEAEIRRIMIQGQSGYIVCEIPSQNKQSKMD
jgi:hypothetical protein